MKRAALALLLLAGCTSAAETAYREQIECLAFFDVPPEEVASPEQRGPAAGGCCGAEIARLQREALAKRDAFRGRALERGRALGKNPEQVRADIRAAHAAFTAELRTMGAHPAEEREEQMDDLCTRRLGA